MKLLEEAGLPPGVINLVYGSGAARRRPRARERRTSPASTSPARPRVFQGMWQTVGENIERYRNYPRIVGETGGKDFIVAHPSADVDGARDGDRPRLVRVPGPEVLRRLARLRAREPLAAAARAGSPSEIGALKMGDVADFANFMGAVIDASSFATQKEAIEEAKAPTARRRSSPAAATTTATAGSSSRP